MIRREFVGLLGMTMIAWPFGVHGQQKAISVIGWLSILDSDSSALADQSLAAFRQGLGEAGYIEGKNLAIQYRWAGGDYDRLPALAADLVARQVDVIAASGGGDVASRAAKEATSTIPIVFIGGGDPVEAGLVASLARPGGNVTGISFNTVELTSKRLELVSELVPQPRIIGLLVNPGSPTAERTIRYVQEAAHTMGVQLSIVKVRGGDEFPIILASLAEMHVGGLVVAGDPVFGNRRTELVALAAQHRMPAIYAIREYVDSGGLISYGPSLTRTYRQAGGYVGRILSGVKPADLPMQQPAVFELVLNLKTAKALGLAIPQTILARADEIIE